MPLQRHLLGVRSADLSLMLSGRTRRPPPRTIAAVHLTDPFGRQAHGRLVGIPQLPHELLGDQAAGVQAIVEAVQYCVAHGAQVVGLGAVAAVIGGQGKAVAREVSCPVTTGNGLTAVAAVDTVNMWRRLSAHRTPVGLLGPPGPVATAILEQLAHQGEHVRVWSATPPRPLSRLAARLNAETHGEVSFTDDLDALLGPGRLLVAASSTGGRLKLSALPPGSVVIDVAAPADVDLDVARRDDVLLLDGEYVRLPAPLEGSAWRKIYGLVTRQRRHIFACFAEPMLLSLADRPDLCSTGRRLPLERLRAIAALASAHGFAVDRLHSGGQPVPASRLAQFLTGELR